jgi:hypothetical protein
VNAVLYLKVLYATGDLVTGEGTGRFSSRILLHAVSSLDEWLVSWLMVQLAGWLLPVPMFVCEDKLNTVGQVAQAV